MRRFLAGLIAIVMLITSVNIVDVLATSGDGDGDINPNPWENLFTSEEPTTQEVKKNPIDIESFVTFTDIPYTIDIVWAETGEQKKLGQVYNIYLDDSLIYQNVICGLYRISKVGQGVHTVKITAALNKIESPGIWQTVTVLGEVTTEETTTEKKPDESTTKEETTTEKKPDESTTKEETTTEKKPDESTTKEETTTEKKPDESTTKEETTTEKKPDESTTKEETTTEKKPDESTTKEETTTEKIIGESTSADQAKEPIDVQTFMVFERTPNTIGIVWAETESQKELGQLYNIYLDGILMYPNVICGYYSLSDVQEGLHIIRITAAINGKESIGLEQSIHVMGNNVTVLSSEAGGTDNTTDDSSISTDQEESSYDTTKTDLTTMPVSTEQKSSTLNTTATKMTTMTPSRTDFMAGVRKLEKVRIKSAVKKRSSKKIKIKLKKKVKAANGYVIRFYKKKKNAVRSSKAMLRIYYRHNRKSFSVSHRKLKNKKKLYIRVKSYIVVGKRKYLSKQWSPVKVVKIKH